jgi:hypothetical protein
MSAGRTVAVTLAAVVRKEVVQAHGSAWSCQGTAAQGQAGNEDVMLARQCECAPS